MFFKIYFKEFLGCVDVLVGVEKDMFFDELKVVVCEIDLVEVMEFV